MTDPLMTLEQELDALRTLVRSEAGHIAYLDDHLDRVVAAAKKEAVVADVLADEHPLLPTDRGHFMCSMVLREGWTFTVHGVLSAPSLHDLPERIFRPMAEQFKAAIERIEAGLL